MAGNEPTGVDPGVVTWEQLWPALNEYLVQLGLVEHVEAPDDEQRIDKGDA